MKNVIMLVYDSFCYDIIGDKRYGRSATPFIDKLREKSIFANNLYSCGPYTEAGLKALLCSCDAADNGGYLHRFGDVKESFLNPLKAAGYEIYHSYFQGLYYDRGMCDQIDHKYFVDYYDYRNQEWDAWGSHFSFYEEKLKNNTFSAYDMEQCIIEMKLVFFRLNDFYMDYFCCNGENEKYDLIRNEKIIGIEKICETIKNEEIKFKKTPEQYVLNLLRTKRNHILYRKLKLHNHIHISEKNLEKAKRENIDFFESCKKKAFILEKNCGLDLKLLSKSIIRNRQYIYNLKDHLLRFKDYETLFDQMKNMYCPSAGKQMQFIMKTIDSREHADNPFFIEFHFEEAHYFNTFLSYDIDDYEYINDEITLLRRDLDCLSNLYPGLLQYRQSIIYLDYWTKKLFSYLKNKNMLDDTVVLITADHGSSYCYEPVRDERRVTNCHSQNYHIPLIIYDSSINHKEVKGFFTSKDVIPTLLDVLGIDKPSSFKGKSMLKDEESPCKCHSEYFGAGVPDAMTRPVQYIARNKKYLIEYEVRVLENFEDGMLRFVYNLEVDPKELHNLVDNIELEEITDLIDYLKQRHKEVKKEFSHIIKIYEDLL